MKTLVRKTKHRKIKMMGRWVILSIFVLLLFNSSGDFISGSVQAQSSSLVVEVLTGALTKEDLVNHLVGTGITVSNVEFTGEDVAAGKFSGGTGIIGFEEGIVLSTGNAPDVVGPNNDNASTASGQPGDDDLGILSGEDPTDAGFPDNNDAAVLEFDFVPAADSLNFRYVFASEEYIESVNTNNGNDFIGFFVNGQNCATVNGDLVSVNTINDGNPLGTDPTNPDLYIDNTDATLNTQMDGLTVVLTCEASVTRDVTNHIKLAIADANDSSSDSNVFLESGSFNSNPPPEPPVDPTLNQFYLPLILNGGG